MWVFKGQVLIRKCVYLQKHLSPAVTVKLFQRAGISGKETCRGKEQCFVAVVWYDINMQAGYIGIEHPLISAIRCSQLGGRGVIAGQWMVSFLRAVAVNGSLVRLPQHQWVFVSQKCLLHVWLGQPNNNTLQRHTPPPFQIPPYLLIDPRLVPTLTGFLFFPGQSSGRNERKNRRHFWKAFYWHYGTFTDIISSNL